MKEMERIIKEDNPDVTGIEIVEVTVQKTHEGIVTFCKVTRE